MQQGERNRELSDFYFEGIRHTIQRQLERDFARYGPLIGELEQMVADYGTTNGFVAFIQHLHDRDRRNPFHRITTPHELHELYRRMTRTQDQRMQRFFNELNGPERRLIERADRAARHAQRTDAISAEGHAEEAAADAAAAAADAEEEAERRARLTIKVRRPRSSEGGKKSHKKSGKRSHKKRTHRRRH
jgi:hypothetical protein